MDALERVIEILEDRKQCLNELVRGCDRDCSHCGLQVGHKDLMKTYNYCLSLLNEYKTLRDETD